VSFPSGRRAVLASRNRHKARELERLLPGWSIEPLERDDYPPETGATYRENAAAKAAFAHAHAPAGAWTLGEDSGLEVEALDGRPGIRSARYAEAANAGGQAAGARPEDPAVDDGRGEGAPAIAKLLGELEEVPDDQRGALYVSELVAVAPDGGELVGSGTLSGRIGHVPRGSEGFGYDPIFVPEGEERTVAELGDEWKARNSHRARAARELLEALDAAAA
jgi:XTP/dITP diphosphohydrolase